MNIFCQALNTPYNQKMNSGVVPLFIRFLPLLLLLVSQPAPADYPIEVIQLKSRSLEEILPVVRPLLGADGTATGMGSSLVLKAAPDQDQATRPICPPMPVK